MTDNINDRDDDFAGGENAADTDRAPNRPIPDDGGPKTANGTPITATTAMNPAAVGHAVNKPVQMVPDGEGGALTVDAANQAVNQKADGTEVKVSNARAIAAVNGDTNGAPAGEPVSDPEYRPDVAPSGSGG